MSTDLSNPDPLTPAISRRHLLQGAAVTAGLAIVHPHSLAQERPSAGPLEEFTYSQIKLRGPGQLAQRENVLSVLAALDDDSLLKPFRAMAGQPAPGTDLGGWYQYKPDYNYHHDDAGLAPAATFGQWLSALARLSAQSEDPLEAAALPARVHRLTTLLASSLTPAYFSKTRFPAYSLDKLICGLMDAHRLTNDPAALPTLDLALTAAEPSLPGRAIDRDIQWKPGADLSWMWDENYTLPENLYLVSTLAPNLRYRRLARAYLDNAFFEPLAHNIDVLADHHAYSYVNSLCSAMQAYFVDGSNLHLSAARNGFALLQQQSFATGGWGPDETLRSPALGELAKSLSASHNGFETPCGSYAHMKLTRYLLRATRDGLYGDSMERILHNTVLGALPLQPDGQSFYSSDYNYIAKRIYSVHRWPCCSGTLPQVVADYGINTYLREPRAVWVNLYQPSELRWTEASTPVVLEQVTEYPHEETIRLRIIPTRPVSFALRLRIPAWTANPTLTVNRISMPVAPDKGFTTIDRLWHPNDLVELTLPMSLRLEPLAEAPYPPGNIIGIERPFALLHGPLVLFAIREPNATGILPVERNSLLGAERTGPMEWIAQSLRGPCHFVPFTEVGERTYSTYIRPT